MKPIHYSSIPAGNSHPPFSHSGQANHYTAHPADVARGMFPVAPPLDISEVEKQQSESRSRLTALAMTVLIHLLVFAVLAWIVLGPLESEPPVLEIIEAPLGVDDPKIEPKDAERKAIRKADPGASGASEMVTTVAPASLSFVSIETPSDSFGNAFGDSFGNGIDGFGPGGGPMIGLPPVIRGRCNQADRARRLRENGGTPALDRKVVAALDWLKSKQNTDGSWGQAFPVAMTGFAILAFSGHCETVDSPQYGPTLISAINYLVDQSRDHDGLMSSKPGQQAPYEHGIATYALAEAYALNKNARARVKSLSKTLRNAVPIIIEGQTKGGGWLYAYAQNGSGDLSISGWNIQALKAAGLTGIRFADMDRTMKNSLAYIKTASTQSGLYRYRIRDNDRGRLSLTGVGVLCARMLGETMSNEDKSLAAILGDRPARFRSADLYALYYHSQACFQKGGKTWGVYNRNQQKLIIDSQENDGSWPVAGGHIGGAKADAKVYHTCLCTLMLEVYYRYLPATDTRK